MTVEDFKVVVKRNVVVGIKLDGHMKELLDWALVKVAYSGDRVVAIHVCRSYGSSLKEKPLAVGFLDDYEGLCNQKQVDLTFQVLKGNSTRKALVREAKNKDAAAVIVGISKHSSLGFRGWTSFARYCAKRLPATTAVLAIYNGKIVFSRSSNSTGLQGDPRPSFYSIGNSVFKDNNSWLGDYEVSEIERRSHEFNPSFQDKLKDGSEESKSDPFCPAEKCKKSSLGSISLYMEDFGQYQPGWPLLSTATSLHLSMDERNLSVVQWVMSLPDRSLGSMSPSIATILSKKTELVEEVSNIAEDGDMSKVKLAENLEILLKASSSSCKLFSFDELKTSTSNFFSENLIGKGGCNSVYRGVLRNGRIVAVKRMKSSKESLKNFTQEVSIMTTIKHKHVSPLLGISIKDDNVFSIYDYCFNGNLADNLHGVNKEKFVLPWDVRFNVAVGIAEALNYIHYECSRPIIHRDVKSANILLSYDYVPQLSDFGLAMWGSITSSFLTHSDLVGTFGYLAPEYFLYGKVSDRIDVYAFGVVLLELLSGRKPIDAENLNSEESLVLWAKPKLENGDFKAILDPRLDKNIPEPQMQRLSFAAMLCLTRSARLRPKISEILNILRGEKEVCRRIKIQTRDYKTLEEGDYNDDEVYPDSSMESHLSLALLDVDDSSTSFSSIKPRSARSLEAYLKGRWSRWSSLD